jgi:histone deacetylase 11
MSIVYSPHYNMGLFGLEKLHPFDTKKFARAWSLLQQEFGATLSSWHVEVDRPITDEELLAVHTADHLRRMRDPNALAKAFEVPAVTLLPFSLVESGFLIPMRWATRGSVIAARQALRHGLSINLGGGFHHAKPDRAEGFCLFSDIALVVAQLRADGSIQQESRIAYVDLDAHQGNGVCHQFLQDARTFIFDMYNEAIYPTGDWVARDRIDCKIPIPIGCEGKYYLGQLKSRLPVFLDSITRSGNVGLAIYTAGTDVFTGDDLGLMALSAADVLERDQFVVDQLRQRQLPTLMLLGGGYTSESHRLIAASTTAILRHHGRQR